MQACQIPSNCTGSVSDYITEKVTSVADSLGINKKNILSSMELMGEYNHFEDQDLKY